MLQRFESCKMSFDFSFVSEEAGKRSSLDIPEKNSQRIAGCHVASSFSYPSLLQKLDAGNQLALIEDLHKDIRIVGNEAKGEHVPGFCIPKKVKDQNECGFITATIPHLLGELIDMTLQLLKTVTVGTFQTCILERLFVGYCCS